MIVSLFTQAVDEAIARDRASTEAVRREILEKGAWWAAEEIRRLRQSNEALRRRASGDDR